VKNAKRAACVLLLVFAAVEVPLASQAPAPGPPAAADEQTAAQQRIEIYLRYLFAWGPTVKVTIGPLLPSALPGVYSSLVQASEGERSLQEVVLVSGDGRYLIRGDFHDTSVDPFAETRNAILTADQPSRGPADAPVTIVEYGDFQCPDCAVAHPVLKKILEERSDVRLVFKDLPLTGKHNWAYAAALAGQCAYQQSNDAFWRLHDFLFENQDAITAETLESKLDAAAPAAGLNLARFRLCRQQKATAARIEQSLQESRGLNLRNTPTVFINGRRFVGLPPREIIDRLIAFEKLLAQQGSPK
jgi:protein-disulfide isomerase